jgi:hypothetical protein
VQSCRCGDGAVEDGNLLLGRLESTPFVPVSVVLNGRRRFAINDVVNEVEGVLVPEVDGCRLTNEDSMLYAGVEGSSSLSVSFGGKEGVEREGIPSKLVVEEEASSETDFHWSV